MNGFLAEETVQSVAEIILWLEEAIAHLCPTSVYAAFLSPEARERARRKLFRPPSVDASVTCPHCGEPSPSREFDELFIFVCSHCGKSVEVQPPKIQ